MPEAKSEASLPEMLSANQRAMQELREVKKQLPQKIDTPEQFMNVARLFADNLEKGDSFLLKTSILDNEVNRELKTRPNDKELQSIKAEVDYLFTEAEAFMSELFSQLKAMPLPEEMGELLLAEARALDFNAAKRQETKDKKLASPSHNSELLTLSISLGLALGSVSEKGEGVPLDVRIKVLEASRIQQKKIESMFPKVSLSAQQAGMIHKILDTIPDNKRPKEWKPWIEALERKK